jgi:hypothetical protein
VGYALKTFHEAREQGWDVNDAAHQFSPSFIFDQIKQSDCLSGGATLEDGLKLVVEKGCLPLSEAPYDPATCDSQQFNTSLNAEDFRFSAFDQVNVNDVDQVRCWLGKYEMPLVVGIKVFDGFQDLKGFDSTYEPIGSDQISSHAVVVTGYDDSRGAFRILNSYGSDWGDNGNAWISYGRWPTLVVLGYVARDEITTVAGVDMTECGSFGVFCTPEDRDAFQQTVLTTEIVKEGTSPLTVSISGGTEPYRFVWTLDGIAISESDQPPELPANVSLGPHLLELQIIDAGGSITTSEIKIVVVECSEPDPEISCYTIDLCPDDPTKTEPGVCGCGRAELDSNLDGAIDCGDPIPTSSPIPTLSPSPTPTPNPTSSPTPCDAPTCELSELRSFDIADGDRYGQSVWIDGDTVIVGAYLDDHSGFVDAGSAYIHQWDGTRWIQSQRLVAPDAGANERFGISVSIDGGIAVVGAYFKNGEQGAIYIYQLNGQTWEFIKQFPGTGGRFGQRVDVSGNRIVASASQSNQVFAFEHNGTDWIADGELTPLDDVTGIDFVRVVIDGDVAVVGASKDDDSGLSESGSAYIFRRSATGWQQEEKLIGDDPQTNSRFGVSTAINGNRILVGAFNHDSNRGSVYVYEFDGDQWTKEDTLTASDRAIGDQFGHSVAISGDFAVIGAIGDNGAATSAGSAYLFDRQDGTWTEVEEIHATGAIPGDEFGYSVAISGNRAIVGARHRTIQNAITPAIDDANTILLDHLDGSTLGTEAGSVTFENGLPGAGLAGSFSPGRFVRFDLPAWYSGESTDPATQGTIEMWVKFSNLSTLLRFNWFETDTPPATGHILSLSQSPSFSLRHSVWNQEEGSLLPVDGTTSLALEEWVHVAVSWSPNGSKVYLNGQVDGSHPENIFPALSSVTYAYLNSWGETNLVALIDELHISSVQRSDQEILDHATRFPLTTAGSAFAFTIGNQ